MVNLIETQEGHYSRLENHLGWRVVAKLDHKYAAVTCISGWLTQYAWNMVTQMKTTMTVERMYDLLEHERNVYLETNRRDSKCILKLVKLSKRRTYDRDLYAIHIGASANECICAVFEPSRKGKMKEKYDSTET